MKKINEIIKRTVSVTTYSLAEITNYKFCQKRNENWKFVNVTCYEAAQPSDRRDEQDQEEEKNMRKHTVNIVPTGTGTWYIKLPVYKLFV